VTIHLRALAGEYELLLESASVRGVSEAGAAATWADRDLPVLDLVRVLGGVPAVEPIDGHHPLRLRKRLDLQAIDREDA
jgi:hypothetical protein